MISDQEDLTPLILDTYEGTVSWWLEQWFPDDEVQFPCIKVDQ